MKKVNLMNLKGISEILSEKELKNVMGGSGAKATECTGAGCSGECTVNGRKGRCKYTSDCYCAIGGTNV